MWQPRPRWPCTNTAANFRGVELGLPRLRGPAGMLSLSAFADIDRTGRLADTSQDRHRLQSLTANDLLVAIAEIHDLQQYCRSTARRVREASAALARVGGQAKIDWLFRSAARLRKNVGAILAVNDLDVAAAPQFGLTDAADRPAAADARERSNRSPRRWKQSPRCPIRSARSSNRPCDPTAWRSRRFACRWGSCFSSTNRART